MDGHTSCHKIIIIMFCLSLLIFFVQRLERVIFHALTRLACYTWFLPTEDLEFFILSSADLASFFFFPRQCDFRSISIAENIIPKCYLRAIEDRCSSSIAHVFTESRCVLMLCQGDQRNSWCSSNQSWLRWFSLYVLNQHFAVICSCWSVFANVCFVFWKWPWLNTFFVFFSHIREKWSDLYIFVRCFATECCDGGNKN